MTMMSRACLPPVQPAAPRDKSHPLYAKYMSYRAGCSSLLIEAMSFEAYCHCENTEREHKHAESHPRFREFQKWMQDTQGGARSKKRFPQNFYDWLAGERW